MSDKSGGGRRTRAALAAGGRRATRSSLDARNALPARLIGRREAEKSARKGSRKRSAVEPTRRTEEEETPAPKKQKKSQEGTQGVGKRRRRAKEDEETKGAEEDDEEETKGGEDDEEEKEEKKEAPPRVEEVKDKRTKRGSEKEKETAGRRSARVQEDEEETKGGEEAHEEADEPERTVGGRIRTRVNIAADVDFVRALVAARERMESAHRKMVVWDEIAEDRFRNGRVAKARLEWLQVVRRDPSHTEYGQLTDEIKALLKELETAAKAAKANSAAGATVDASPKSPKSPKKRKRLGFVDPVRQRRLRRESLLASQAATTSDETETVAKETVETRENKKETKDTAVEELTFGSPLTKLHRFAGFDSSAEENLMRLVLEHVTKVDESHRKIGMWDAIAAATRGKYTSGISVKNHVWWVVRSLKDPQHRVSKEASPELRELVKTYVDLRSNTLTEQERSTVAVDDSPKPPTTSKEPTVRVAVDETIAPVSRPSIEVASDEQLLLFVLEKISRGDTDQAKEKNWDEIAQAVGRQNSRITNGADAKAKLAWLLTVHEDATHAEHKNLPASLRKMLDDYKSKKSTQPTEELRPLTPKAADIDAHNASENRVEDEDEAEVENDEDGDETRDGRPQDQRRSKHVQVNVKQDEELMRLVLLWRPSQLDRSTKGAVWAKIVDALQDPKITNGLAAHGRVRWLLNIYQQASETERSSLLSDKLVTMLKEYSVIDDASKADGFARVLNLNVDVTGDDDEHDPRADPNHGLLLRELLRLRPFHAKLGSGMGVWKQVAAAVNRAAGAKVYPTGQSCLSQMKRLLAVVRNTTKTDIFLTKKQRAMTLLVDALLKIRWPKSSADITDDHKACLQKIQRLLDGQPDLRVSPRYHVPQASPINRERPASSQRERQATRTQFTYEYSPPATDMDPVDVLQADIARFRETAARDRASREDDLANLRQKATACRAQLSEQMDKYDDERREQRDELRSVMELLKGEREMHARENAMVLQVVQKERDDRRQEFGTLVNLVTRALLGREHMQPNA